jgi:hypothetical protein
LFLVMKTTNNVVVEQDNPFSAGLALSSVALSD